MNKFFDYDPTSDPKFSTPKISDIRHEFDGVVTHAYEVFPNYMIYLRKLGIKTGWRFKNDRPYLGGEPVGPKALLYSLEAYVYEVMNIATASSDKPRIQLNDFPITLENMNEFEDYCDLLLDNQLKDIEEAFAHTDLAIFLVACISLGINNMEDLKFTIQWLRQLYIEA